MASGWRGHENFGRAVPPSYSPPPKDYSRLAYNSSYGKTAPRKPERKHVMILSQVHWCEFGGTENGHPFSSKDPDKERIVRSKETERTDQYGTKITEDEEFYLCGKHANGLFRGDADKAPTGQIAGTVADS